MQRCKRVKSEQNRKLEGLSADPKAYTNLCMTVKLTLTYFATLTSLFLFLNLFLYQ